MTAARAESGGSSKTLWLRPLDHAILSALLTHRVLTTQHVAQACATPVRTARYRLTRMLRANPPLVARKDRPYAAEGSAPDHWWLTSTGRRRAGDDRRIRRGDGDSADLLAHSAATAAVPLALARVGPANGLRLDGWLRDSEAWETWTQFGTGEQTITPDGLAHISVDGQALVLPVFMEVDLASSTVLRLRAKAPRYLDYANLRAWQSRHETCPALLVLTTTDARAGAFLRATKAARPPTYFDVSHKHEMLVAASADVFDVERAVTEAVWRTEINAPPVTLHNLLAEHVAGVTQAPRKRTSAGYPGSCVDEDDAP